MTTWTLEQNAIFDFVLNDTRNGVVQAGPGCGKTTTTLEALKRFVAEYPNKKAAIMAFNVSIRQAILEKNPTLTERKEVWGINQFGNSLVYRLGKTWLVKNKYYQLAWAFVNGNLDLYEDAKSLRSEAYRIARIVTLLREGLVDLNNPEHVAAFYELHGNDFVSWEIPAYKALMALGKVFARDKRERQAAVNALAGIGVNINTNEEAEVAQATMSIISNFTDLAKWVRNYSRIIDFTDQIWLPLEWNLVKPQFDLVFVDESQDLSLAKIQLALKSGKRFMFVGDRFQSMYLFAGAASNSMSIIQEESQAIMLPLQTSFRLPKLHVWAANAINPDLVAHEDNIEGDIISLENDILKGMNIMNQQANGNGNKVLVMSRTNADLTKLATSLLAAGIGFSIRGRDFGKQIVNTLENIFLSKGKEKKMKRGYSFDNFIHHIDEWYARELIRLDSENARSGLYVALEDKLSCFKILHQRADATTFEELCDYILEIFEQDSSDNLVLSSIHKAKGDEAPVTFIVNPEKLPFYHPKMTVDAEEQETYVQFVAMTRSLSTMYELSLPQ